MEKGMRQGLKYILLVVICVVFLFPLVWALACSIKPESEILSYPPKWIPDTLTVSNYTTVLEKYPYLSWGANSLTTVVCGTLMIPFLSSLAAYALGRFEFCGCKLIYDTIVTMLLIPIQVYMIPLYLMCAKIGLLNTYVSIIFPSATNVTSIFILTSFFKGLSRELEEAARIDGCGEFTIFLRIMLPLSKPTLSTVAILTFIADWDSFLWPMVATHSDEMLTLPVRIAQLIDSVNSNMQFQYGTALTAYCMATTPTITVFLLLQRYFVEGIATSGTKRWHKMKTDIAGLFRQIEKESILGEQPPLESCHASSLTIPPNGDSFCIWSAGGREGEDNVIIWGARHSGGSWQKPQILQQNGLPHWSPILFVQKDGSVWLLFKIGREISSWRTWAPVSYDGCHTRSPMRELVPGDVGGRGPVRNKLIVLSSGRWLAPASLENGQWRSFADRSNDEGETWSKSSEVFIPLAGTGTKSLTYQEIPVSEQSFTGRGAIQSTLWEFAPGKIHMLMRTSEGSITRSDSQDSGETWYEGYAMSLPDNNSSIDLDRTADGRLSLVYNPVGEGRGPRFPLHLALSEDNRQTWEDTYTLEEAEGECSYPSVNYSDNSLFVTCTNCRKSISFWCFELEEQRKEARL